MMHAVEHPDTHNNKLKWCLYNSSERSNGVLHKAENFHLKEYYKDEMQDLTGFCITMS